MSSVEPDNSRANSMTSALSHLASNLPCICQEDITADGMKRKCCNNHSTLQLSQATARFRYLHFQSRLNAPIRYLLAHQCVEYGKVEQGRPQNILKAVKTVAALSYIRADRALLLMCE
jgi:hypothetical protein